MRSSSASRSLIVILREHRYTHRDTTNKLYLHRHTTYILDANQNEIFCQVAHCDAEGIYIHTYTETQPYIYMHTPIYIHVCTHVCTCVRSDTYSHIHTHTQRHIHVHTYIHTHRYTHRDTHIDMQSHIHTYVETST